EVTADTRAKITSFVERYFKGNIVMTTQPLEWLPPSTADFFALQPLNQNQMAEFLISRYSSLVETDCDASVYQRTCENYVSKMLSPSLKEEESTAIRHTLSNPMDLTLIAQMLSHNEMPDLFRLQEQQYQIMATDYQVKNLHSFPLCSFSEAVYQMRSNDQEIIQSAQFWNELCCLERYKMVLGRQSRDIEGNPIKVWSFRHDKIEDYFIVQTFLGENNTRPKKHMNDPRFRGVYFLMATLLSKAAAKKLREKLIHYAADSGDHTVSDTFVKLLLSREEMESVTNNITTVSRDTCGNH
ncbi:MAG: PBS lyase, partial [Cyanobacteria bacterium P01_A01_bin.114]